MYNFTPGSSSHYYPFATAYHFKITAPCGNVMLVHFSNVPTSLVILISPSDSELPTQLPFKLITREIYHLNNISISFLPIFHISRFHLLISNLQYCSPPSLVTLSCEISLFLFLVLRPTSPLALFFYCQTNDLYFIFSFSFHNENFVLDSFT